jgi:hypothetical protein
MDGTDIVISQEGECRATANNVKRRWDDDGANDDPRKVGTAVR